MKESYREMIRAIDTIRCRSLSDYFKILKAIFTTDELVKEIFMVSYSTFYQFNRGFVSGDDEPIVSSTMYKRLYRLYHASKNNILPAKNWDQG